MSRGDSDIRRNDSSVHSELPGVDRAGEAEAEVRQVTWGAALRWSQCSLGGTKMEKPKWTAKCPCQVSETLRSAHPPPSGKEMRQERLV